MTAKQYDDLYIICKNISSQNESLIKIVQDLQKEIFELKGKVITQYNLYDEVSNLKIEVNSLKDEMEV